jgi:hypothetical protein
MQNFDHNIFFEENANFFVENCQKSQKIVIITSTPGQQQPFFRTRKRDNLVAKKLLSGKMQIRFIRVGEIRSGNFLGHT